MTSDNMIVAVAFAGLLLVMAIVDGKMSLRKAKAHKILAPFVCAAVIAAIVADGFLLGLLMFGVYVAYTAWFTVLYTSKRRD